ncbi:MAG: helix-turn-helix transcriptional regulator [Gammaproteobacteria bacterium]|nr:helix-turn-helix transcriptional regulator [Gammaproteobacteria bacterium]
MSNCEKHNPILYQSWMMIMIISSTDLPAFAELSIWHHRVKQCQDNSKINFLVKITKQLEQNYTNPDLKVNSLARNIAVSERQIYRIFKELLDTTPSNFLQLYRLEKAFSLMQQGETFGNIAFDVGFSSHSYFTHCFKNKFGQTPSAFMKTLKKERLAGYCEK